MEVQLGRLLAGHRVRHLRGTQSLEHFRILVFQHHVRKGEPTGHLTAPPDAGDDLADLPSAHIRPSWYPVHTVCSTLLQASR